MSWTSLLGHGGTSCESLHESLGIFPSGLVSPGQLLPTHPRAPMELEFPVLRAELALLRAAVLWGLSLDLSRFSQPPLEQCSLNGNSALRVAFPLFCVRNFS